jgi:hypothetical protein
MECNENGFTKADVEALCRIGRGTKAEGLNSTQGSRKPRTIGEKGIGFKAVFKTASKVNIASHPFYFELDSARELGMIAPVWNREFFKARAKDVPQTSIVLSSPVEKDKDFVETLLDDIQDLRPTILLFLNKLRTLEILIEKPGFSRRSTFSRSYLYYPDSNRLGLVYVKDERGSDRTKQWSYFKSDFEVQHMPKEEKRPNVSFTNISLAFPVVRDRESWIPTMEVQNVFAYLPLGNFGFRVRVHAVLGLNFVDRSIIVRDQRRFPHDR